MSKYIRGNSAALLTSPAASLTMFLLPQVPGRLLRVWEEVSAGAADTPVSFLEGSLVPLCSHSCHVCLLGGMGTSHSPLLTCPSATTASLPLGDEGWAQEPLLGRAFWWAEVLGRGLAALRDQDKLFPLLRAL